MPPRRVQLKSSLATVIAKAKKNLNEQKQCFEREAGDLIENWFQNSLKNFDALQLQISELLLNDGCSENQQVIAKKKPIKVINKINPSMPSLEPLNEEPNVADLIKSLEHFVEEGVPIQNKNVAKKSLQSSMKGINSSDPMFGFAKLPIVMTPSTAPITKPFMDTAFDMDLSNNPVTFSEYELNEIGELTLLSADIVKGISSEQMNLPNVLHNTLEQSNHTIPLDKQNANKRMVKQHHTTGMAPLKRRKKDENAVPNAIELLEGPTTGFMQKKNVAKETVGSKHKIIIDKETLGKMREQKKNAKKANAINSKAKTTEVALLL